MILIRTVICIVVAVLVSSIAGPGAMPALADDWRAGAAAVDITPLEFPVKVNGGMMSRTATQTSTPIFARALVIQEGEAGEPLAIVVVDSCMMPRPLLDEAKQLAAQRCGIDPDRMTISATHTHTAPSAMGALGTDVDERYVPYLRNRLAEAIVTAAGNLEPAEIGFGATDAGQFTAVRRWIRRTDLLAEDPFGNLTVQANMHAASNWDDVTGPAGPEDPELAAIGVR